MTQPQQQPKPKWKLAAAPVAAVVAIVAALQTSEQRVHTAYWDHLGKVWTVCAGITGPDVVEGLTLTDAECEAREVAYVEKMLARMGRCVATPLTFNEIKAWGHFSYNVGNANFCGSTAARLLNEGRNREACEQITRWTLIKGKDCRNPANKCGGIVKRREWERQTCLSSL